MPMQACYEQQNSEPVRHQNSEIRRQRIRAKQSEPNITARGTELGLTSMGSLKSGSGWLVKATVMQAPVAAATSRITTYGWLASRRTYLKRAKRGT